MYLKYPFEYAEIEGLGKLFYPIVSVGLKTIYGYRKFDFLVDTGADVTTLPSSTLPYLGIDKNKLKISNTLGVGGIKVKTYEFILPVRFGKIELKIGATAVDADESTIPLLLGRKDIFESEFNLIIDSKRKITVLEKN